MMDTTINRILVGLFISFQIWIFMLSGCEGLMCYNCRGITNFDPSNCFNPSPDKTVQQECQKGEACEMRVTMVDRLQDVIDRGCSSNCNGRKFVWTDEFQVYCCDDQDFCNSAKQITSSVSLSVALLISLCVVLVVRYM